MLNVIIPISQNAQDFVDIVGRLGRLESVKLYVGICESEHQDFKAKVEQAENLLIFVYQDGSDREEILNSLQTEIEDSGAVMIMRKPITMAEFNKFISSRKDIVTCQRNMSKFKAFFFMLWQKIIKAFLGVKLYEGDPSVIYMGEEISVVSAQSGNLSYSSRVDRWRGIEQGVVQTTKEAVKATVDKKKNINLLIYAVIAIAIATIVTTLVCVFAKMSIIIGLLIVCLDIIAVAIALIMGIMALFNCMVGKRHFGNAFKIEGNNKE